ncbi:MAG: chorismate-binding protein, partial [Planctomycetota bacterium]
MEEAIKKDVHVPQLMEVHEYSHVQHIVSRVVGTLKPDCDSYDAS